MTDPLSPSIAGRSIRLEPDIRRILAPNPSPMTYVGTNTYVLGQGAVCVIDPGPDSDAHLHAILAALKPTERVAAILCTHAHLDHSPLSSRLRDVTGAPVYAFGTAFAGESPMMTDLRAEADLGGGEGIDHSFVPDILLADDQVLRVGSMDIRAIWTPGHLSNHMCFLTKDRMFSGDHVMGWATSMISPPDGDLGAFMASLRKLEQVKARVYYPGHGEAVHHPHTRVAELIAHRTQRESQILSALTQQKGSAKQLAERIYTEIDPALIPAAARNVLAHLIALTQQNKVQPVAKIAPDVVFEIA